MREGGRGANSLFSRPTMEVVNALRHALSNPNIEKHRNPQGMKLLAARDAAVARLDKLRRDNAPPHPLGFRFSARERDELAAKDDELEAEVRTLEAKIEEHPDFEGMHALDQQEKLREHLKQEQLDLEDRTLDMYDGTDEEKRKQLTASLKQHSAGVTRAKEQLREIDDVRVGQLRRNAQLKNAAIVGGGGLAALMGLGLGGYALYNSWSGKGSMDPPGLVQPEDPAPDNAFMSPQVRREFDTAVPKKPLKRRRRVPVKKGNKKKAAAQSAAAKRARGKQLLRKYFGK